MRFWTEFGHTLFWRPRQALVGLYWHLTRRRVRARNVLRKNFHEAPHSYQVWIDLAERGEASLAAAHLAMAKWPDAPTITLILPWLGSVSTSRLAATVHSILAQILAPIETIAVIPDGVEVPASIARDGIRLVRAPAGDAMQALDAAIAKAKGEWVMPLTPGATLQPLALFRIAEAIRDAPDAVALYGDHDLVGVNGWRESPWLKPQWNAEMLLAQDYVSQACVVSTATARLALPLASDCSGAEAYTLFLRIARVPGAKIVHIPNIIANLPVDFSPNDQAARLAAVTEAIAPLGAAALPESHGLVRVVWPLPVTTPTVSVIIPTRDQVDVLQRCIESLYSRTRWSSMEVLVVDNGSVQPETHAYLATLQARTNLRIIEWKRPFNYSEINNAAARQARGDFLCLLNNDTEIIEPLWLELLMRQAVREEVGAVGAKLLYPDGTIQHAGVVIGMGNAAGHAHRFQKSGDPGYFLQADVTRYASAVTAACLVVASDKFHAVGGLDEHELAIAYNDVDLCLKLQNAGWHNVYVPHAVLLHHESISRGNDLSAPHRERYMRELAVLQKRWKTDTMVDPYFHPQLDRARETFSLRTEQ